MVRKLLGNIQGPRGSQGPQGDTGLQGEQGPQGPQGPPGVVITSRAERFVLYGYTVKKTETDVSFVGNQSDTIPYDNGFDLDSGTFLITFQLRAQLSNDILLRNRYWLRLYLDDQVILRKLTIFGEQYLNFSHVIKTTGGKLNLTTEIFTKDTEDDEIPLFTGKEDSVLTITKIGV